MPPTTVYGHRRSWADLYESVVTSAPDLRGRLESLRQAAHRGADPDDVEAVQAALFATHQPEPASAPAPMPRW